MARRIEIAVVERVGEPWLLQQRAIRDPARIQAASRQLQSALSTWDNEGGAGPGHRAVPPGRGLRSGQER
jgi:hypothetical protein